MSRRKQLLHCVWHQGFLSRPPFCPGAPSGTSKHQRRGVYTALQSGFFLRLIAPPRVGLPRPPSPGRGGGGSRGDRLWGGGGIPRDLSPHPPDSFGFHRRDEKQFALYFIFSVPCFFWSVGPRDTFDPGWVGVGRTPPPLGLKKKPPSSPGRC